MADTKTVVAPFSRPSDVTVVMDVAHPQPIQGLGNMLILNFLSTQSGSNTQATDNLTDDEVLDGVLKKKVDKTTGALYREYANLDALAKHGYDETTGVYAKAKAYFAQNNHSDRVAVLDLSIDKMRDALEAFWYFNWTFAILSKPIFLMNSVAST